MTYKGKEKAEELVRAHRLWESYQVEKMGLTEGQIHDEAERLEHHLTEDILDQVDVKLGFPKIDPHGSPIPPKKIGPKNPLISVKKGVKYSISKSQLNDQIESDLWELGLVPKKSIVLYRIEKETITILYDGIKKTIPASLASVINVEKA